MIVRRGISGGPPPIYTLTVDVYEPGATYPVVRHVFYGRTPLATRQLFRRHLKLDSFLRAHVERGDVRLLSGPSGNTPRKVAA